MFSLLFPFVPFVPFASLLLHHLFSLHRLSPCTQIVYLVSFSLGFVEPSFSFLFGSVDTAFEVEAEQGLFTGEEEEEEEEEDDDLLGISNS